MKYMIYYEIYDKNLIKLLILNKPVKTPNVKKRCIKLVAK